MLLSKISELLRENISFGTFRKHIEEEISDYKVRLTKKGSSNPIFLNEDLEELFIRQTYVKFLCEGFLQEKIDKWELNYVAEALLLSSKVIFENDKVEEALLALTDPEYYKIITRKFVETILEDLKM